MKQHNMKTPCVECPWTKNVTPGALGGSPTTTYIGQVVGPFVLPCRMACDFSDPNWKAKVMSTAQCAGAAAFRARIGVDRLMPDGIHKLPPNADVFESAAAFMAHHDRTTLEAAQDRLKETPPHVLLARELARPSRRDYDPSTGEMK